MDIQQQELFLSKFDNLHNDLKTCKYILSKNPQNVKALNTQGFILNNLGYIDEAMVTFQKAMALDPQNPQPYINIAKIYLDEKQYVQSIEFLEKAEKITNGKEQRVYELWEMCLQAMKKFEESKEKALKILELNPENEFAANAIGNLLSNLNKGKESIEWHKKAVEINPNFEIGFSNLASAYQDQDNLRLAKINLNKSIQINPYSEHAFYEYANIFGIERNYKKAEEFYKKALEINSNSIIAYNYWGYTVSESDDPQKKQKSIELFQKAIDKYYYSQYSYEYIGDIHYTDEELDLAIEYYQKQINIKPYSSSAYNGYADVLLEQGNLDEALEKYEKAIEICPTFVSAQANIAQIHGLNKQYTLQDKGFEKALKLAPNNKSVLFKQLISFVECNRLQEFLVKVRQYTKLFPKCTYNVYELWVEILKEVGISQNVQDAVQNFGQFKLNKFNIKDSTEIKCIYQINQVHKSKLFKIFRREINVEIMEFLLQNSQITIKGDKTE